MPFAHLDYAEYNIWANNLLIETLLAQPQEILHQKLTGSFPTIYATIQHIWSAEAGWLAHLKGEKDGFTDPKHFDGPAKALFAAWQQTSAQFRDYVAHTNLEETVPLTYRGKLLAVARHEIAQTVFNHGSYHRGQVVMMLRQLGVEQIPQTDYVHWVRVLAWEL